MADITCDSELTMERIITADCVFVSQRRRNQSSTPTLAVLLCGLALVAAFRGVGLAGDGADGDGSDIPNNGRLRTDAWTFQFGPLTGRAANTIMLDDTPGSKPPTKASVAVVPAKYAELAVLFTGVAVGDAKPGKITVSYATGPSDVLEPWEFCDWVAPETDRSKVVLQGCDWWRSDRGFVTGDARVSLYAQMFDIDASRAIESVEFSVEGIGTAGDVGVFAISGRPPGAGAAAQPIDISRSFNFDAVINDAEDDVSAGFRHEHKPQYFATERASATIKSTSLARPESGVAPLADPSEIHRTEPDLIVYDPTGGKKRPWDEIRLWNEHFLVQETKDGNLLATWTSTTRAVGYSRSVDGGRTWSTPEWFEGDAGWQVPVIAPGGRVYLLSTHGGFSGGLSCRTSDDHGKTWRKPVELSFPTTDLDRGRAQWISCTVPHWDTQGRPLIAYTHWASSDSVPGGTAGITSRYCQIELMRIENLSNNPPPRDLEFSWLCRESPVTVPHESIEGASFAQEPYVVDLPDGRMMMTMRTNRGEAWYTVSDDQGERWCKAEPMRYRDGGDILQQPVSPAALFRIDRGDYIYLFNNNDGYVFGATSRWDVRNRRPAYISRGEFRPGARQPIWFSESKLFVDNQGVKWRRRLDAATYTSLTEHRGRRVVWYPDRKGFLLGKYINDAWLDAMKVPQ